MHTPMRLGSLMGDEDEEDVVKRMALATVQFRSLEKVWGRVKSLKSRMNAYNAFILPVLLFNASAWGVCESVIKKIEVFHRKQLRRVLATSRCTLTVGHSKSLTKLCTRSVVLSHLGWRLGAFAGTCLVTCYVCL